VKYSIGKEEEQPLEIGLSRARSISQNIVKPAVKKVYLSKNRSFKKMEPQNPMPTSSNAEENLFSQTMNSPPSKIEFEEESGAAATRQSELF